jgi:HAMP domain-containing protein
MRLIVKFNLVITLAFMAGLAVSVLLMRERFIDDARTEVLANARIMLQSSDSIMRYTSQEVTPLPRALGHDNFVRAASPFFAAASIFEDLRRHYPDYSVRNVALNPTNLRDRPTESEADIINGFRAYPDRTELVTERQTPTGLIMSLSRPLVATPECLTCHSTPANAPSAMIATYGSANGFGWQAGETVGAQIVSVPLSLPLAQAGEAVTHLLLTCGTVFLVVLVILNLFLYHLVVKPIRDMARIANDVSLGKPNTPEYEREGRDEIATLSLSFNRMRRSLESALELIEGA